MSNPRGVYYRGAAAERALIALLRRNGWYAVRAPRSGKSYGIDVIAIKNGRAVLFEVKRRREFTTIQLPKNRYEQALVIARSAGAPLLLALNITSLRKWVARPLTEPDSISNATVSFKPNEKWIDLYKLLVIFSN